MRFLLLFIWFFSQAAVSQKTSGFSVFTDPNLIRELEILIGKFKGFELDPIPSKHVEFRQLFEKFVQLKIFTSDQVYSNDDFRLVGASSPKTSFYFRYFSPSVFEVHYSWIKGALESIQLVKESDALRIIIWSKDPKKSPVILSEVKKWEDLLCQMGRPKLIEVFEKYAWLWSVDSDQTFFGSPDLWYLPLFQDLQNRGLIPPKEMYSPDLFNKSYIFQETNGLPKLEFFHLGQWFRYIFRIDHRSAKMVGREKACTK